MYLYLKAFHVIAVISWMAGLLYLPRLFVNHTKAAPGSELSEVFKGMEGRLLNIITTPAMLVSWGLGLVILIFYQGWDLFSEGWFHVKLTLVGLLTVFHGFLYQWRRDFLHDRNRRSEKFYRVVNEIPTLLMIGIVIMVVVRPF